MTKSKNISNILFGKKWMIVDVAIMLFIFIVSVWGVWEFNHIYTVSDEFGYWGIAATLAGYDWSDMLGVTGYYAFGYSILLYPLALLTRLGISMSTAYKLGIVLNSLLLTASYPLIVSVSTKVFKSLNRIVCVGLATFSVLSVGNTTRTRIEWCESCFFFVFCLVMFFFVSYIEKRTLVSLCLLVTSTFYLLCVHLRAIGVVGALALTLFLILIFDKEKRNWKHIIILGILTLIGSVSFILIKRYVNDYIYGAVNNTMAAVNNSINDFDYQVGRISKFMSVSGFANLLLSIIGKLYYQFAATFMISLVGILYGIGTMISSIVKKEWRNECWFYGFSILAFMAEVLICAYFKCYSVLTNPNSAMGDTIIFGRYADCVVWPIVVMGIYVICEKYHNLKWLSAISVLIFALITYITQWQYEIMTYYKGDVGIRGGASPWLDLLYANSTYRLMYYAMLIALLVFGALVIARSIGMQQGRKLGLFLMSAILVAIGIWGGIYGIRYGVDYYEYKAGVKAKTVDSVKTLIESSDVSEVYIISDDTPEMGDMMILQWELGDVKLKFLSVDKLFETDWAQSLYLVRSDADEITAKLNCDYGFRSIYNSGSVNVLVSSQYEDIEKIQSDATKCSKITLLSTHSVDLSTITTEYSYVKHNKSLYYNYGSEEAANITGFIPGDYPDGTYRFDIDLRVIGATGGEDVGYITVGSQRIDIDGENSCLDESNIQNKIDISGESFIHKNRQTISVSVDVWNNEMPYIGVFTYGKSSIRIYDISYTQIQGNIDFDEEETGNLLNGLDYDVISNANANKTLYYVDSNSSGSTGFPILHGINYFYISGNAIMNYEYLFPNAVFLVEKTDEEVLSKCTEMGNVISENDDYILVEGR